MRRIEDRAAAIGRAARERTLMQIEQALRERHIAAELRDGAVVLSGQGLVHRWLRDSSLRFVTGLIR